MYKNERLVRNWAIAGRKENGGLQLSTMFSGGNCICGSRNKCLLIWFQNNTISSCDKRPNHDTHGFLFQGSKIHESNLPFAVDI